MAPVRVLSPLTEGRGLKHKRNVPEKLREVAPHGGAWIETLRIRLLENVGFVAPHGGAWIETFINIIRRETSFVAPHGGAWIETFSLY